LNDITELHGDLRKLVA